MIGIGYTWVIIIIIMKNWNIFLKILKKGLKNVCDSYIVNQLLIKKLNILNKYNSDDRYYMENLLNDHSNSFNKYNTKSNLVLFT